MQLYEKLTALRTKHDLTIERLSQLSGVPEGTIAKIMSGNTRNPSFDNVVDILTAMGEPINSVLEDPPADSENKTPQSGMQHQYLCDHCPSLIASRTSYTHAFTEIKHQHHITQCWIVFIVIYAIILTVIEILK